MGVRTSTEVAPPSAGAARATVLVSGPPSSLEPPVELAPGALFAAAALVERAGRGLALCRASVDPDERYDLAHLAALRTAAAVLAAHGPSVGGARASRRGPAVEVWQTLVEVAPALTAWAALFSAGARRRREIARGVRVPQGEADDLMERSEEFLEAVLRHLGLPVRVGPVAATPEAVDR